nr:unnamed protein product [Digitaria exilis]
MRVVACPQDRGLWMATREFWLLPDEEQFAPSCSDWLLLLLDKCSPVQRDLVKLILWKAWMTHNNITHQAGPTGIHDGVQALLSMRTSLEQIAEDQTSFDLKGTASKLHRPVKGKGKGRISDEVQSTWNPPPKGWSKVNVDGSFIPATRGEAGVGIIARNSDGQVIFSAWKVLFRCLDAAEAEARACMEGIRFAAQWAPGKVIIESDCSRTTGRTDQS